MLQVCFLGQALRRVEQLAAADARSPDANVVRVFQLCEVGGEPVGIEEVNLFLPAERLVARERDYLYPRGHHEEGHVEAYLVVAGPRRAVGNGVGAYLVGVACYGHGLEYALRAHRDGVAVVAQHVAEYHVLERFLVVLVRYVERYVLLGAQLVCVLFVFLELRGAEPARVGACGVNVVTVFCQFHYCVRGVQPSGEGHHNFLVCHVVVVFLRLLFLCLF